MDIFEELHKLKAEYMDELKKAQAKCEVVDDLIAKFAFVNTPFEENPVIEETETEVLVEQQID